MNFAQSVTVKEYFKIAMREQKDFITTRWQLARAYLLRKKLAPDSSGTVQAMRELADKSGVPVVQKMREIARLQLMHLILNDFMEFNAEFGCATLVAKHDDNEDFKSHSYSRVTNVDMLETVTELNIVPCIERPLMTVSNDDLYPPNYAIIKLGDIPKEIAAKKSWDSLVADKIDYDSLTEEQWVEAVKERDRKLRVATGLEKEKDDYEQSLLQEYEHEKIVAAKSASYLGARYPDWISED